MSGTESLPIGRLLVKERKTSILTDASHGLPLFVLLGEMTQNHPRIILNRQLTIIAELLYLYVVDDFAAKMMTTRGV